VLSEEGFLAAGSLSSASENRAALFAFFSASNADRLGAAAAAVEVAIVATAGVGVAVEEEDVGSKVDVFRGVADGTGMVNLLRSTKVGGTPVMGPSEEVGLTEQDTRQHVTYHTRFFNHD
jgi:hypothetical protein